MNLLEQFILQHVQVTQLKAKLLKPGRSSGNNEAKVELQLTPRMMKTDSGDKLPAYQVTAVLNCKSGKVEESAPQFETRVRIEAIYQQFDGEAMDVAEFSANHASLTRQLYPLLAQELRILLMRLGLEQVRLPFDLATRVEAREGEPVKVSGAVH